MSVRLELRFFAFRAGIQCDKLQSTRFKSHRIPGAETLKLLMKTDPNKGQGRQCTPPETQIRSQNKG